MVSLATAIARRGGMWSIWLRIESLGLSTTQYTFCSKPPTYAGATWLDYLAADSLPRTLTERVEPFGGAKDVGQFSFNLIDRGDFLTKLLRWDAPPYSTLTGNVTRAASTITFAATGRSGFSLAAGSILYIGQEALAVTGFSGPTASVTRGVLGTTAAAHYTGDPVRSYPPRLEGRTVTLGIVPYDATDSTAELELDTFSIRQVGYTPDWTGYTFACVSRLAALIRTVGAASAGSYQLGAILKGQTLLLRAVLQPASAIFGVWPGFSGYSDRYFVLDGKEYVTANPNALPGAFFPRNATYCSIQITSRSRLGTSQVKLDNDAINGQMRITTPLVADTSDGIGSFRFSPGPSPSTDRTSGTWYQSAHWCDILLCLFLSSQSVNDGLTMVNYPAGGPNHSALEIGWGAGIRVARCNVTSFLAVKDRTPDWLFPAFVLDKAANLADVVNNYFLRPLGAYITTKNGQLTLVLPRLSYVGQPATVLDKTLILRKRLADGTYEPRITGTNDPGNQARAVLLNMTAPNGDVATRLITASQFGGQLTQYDAPVDQNSIMRLDIPGVRADQAGTDVLCEQIALRQLFRAFNPPRMIEAYGDLSTYANGLGDVLQVTADLMPNPVTGVRGVVTLGTIIERGTNLDVKTDDPGFRYRILDYGPVQGVGLVAPAANISAWSFPGGATHGTATILSQAYTDAAAAAPLPSTDAAQFAVGMVVKLLNQDGTRASPGAGPGQTQVITNVILTVTSGHQTLWLDGDFNGMAGSIVGKILVLAGYDLARAADQATYAAEADTTYLTVGSGTRGPWLWGDP